MKNSRNPYRKKVTLADLCAFLKSGGWVDRCRNRDEGTYAGVNKFASNNGLDPNRLRDFLGDYGYCDCSVASTKRKNAKEILL